MNVQIQSYPRSGSNYLLTVLQYIYRCDVKDLGSIAYKDYKNFFNDVEEGDVMLSKSHVLTELDMTDKFIMLVRDPLEAITRHNDWSVQIAESRGNKFTATKREEFTDAYVDRVDEFNAVNKPKLIVHYEDLMTDTESVIKEIIEFIGTEPKRSMEEYVENKQSISDKAASNHKFVTVENANNTNLKRHQQGMPDDVREYYKGKLSHLEVLNRYFDE